LHEFRDHIGRVSIDGFATSLPECVVEVDCLRFETEFAAMGFACTAHRTRVRAAVSFSARIPLVAASRGSQVRSRPRAWRLSLVPCGSQLRSRPSART